MFSYVFYSGSQTSSSMFRSTILDTSFSFYATEAGKYKRLCSSKGFRNDCKNNFLPCRRGCLRIFGMGL